MQDMPHTKHKATQTIIMSKTVIVKGCQNTKRK